MTTADVVVASESDPLSSGVMNFRAPVSNVQEKNRRGTNGFMFILMLVSTFFPPYFLLLSFFLYL